MLPLEPRLLLSTTYILPLGDSITQGENVNVVDNEPGGYRAYLQNLFDLYAPGLDDQYVGNRQHGSLGIDRDHFGWPGAQAAVDGYGGTVSGLKQALDNGQVYDLNGPLPNTVLLHIGSNTVKHSIESLTDPIHYNSTFNEYVGGGIPQFDALMGSMQSAFASNQFAPDAQFYIAKILPRGGDNTSGDPDSVSQLRSAIAHVSAYNDHIADYVSALLSGTPEQQAFGSRIHMVDMFTISLDALKLDWLADLFTSGDESLLTSTIDPDSDGYVDWFLGLDEAGDPLNTASVSWRNDALLDSINIHPDELGYAIMANVWASALIPPLTEPQPGQVVVSPPSRDYTTEDPAGGATTFTVKLSKQPTANVTLTLTLSDGSEARFGNGTTTRTVVLTADNWSTGVTVSVVGQDDAVVDGDVPYTVTFSHTTSSDPAFSNLSLADKTLTFVNRDNDEPPPPAPATIAGRVFADANTNGVFDADEAGIAGWTVYLDADNDGSLDADETAANTDTQGRYSFTGLSAGSYVVRYHLAAGWQVAPAPGAADSYVVGIVAGQNVTGRDFAASLIPDPTSGSGGDPDSTPDGLGDTFATAGRLPTVHQPTVSFTESVGGDDSADVLRFRVTTTSKVFARLAGLTSDVKLQLYNAKGKLIQSFDRPGVANERFVRKLERGRYYLRIVAVDPDPTLYNFKIVTRPWR